MVLLGVGHIPPDLFNRVFSFHVILFLIIDAANIQQEKITISVCEMLFKILRIKILNKTINNIYKIDVNFLCRNL